MEKRKQSYFRPDPRTWLLLCLLGIASILLVHSEIGGLCLFLGSNDFGPFISCCL